VQSLAGKFSFAATVLPGARPFFRRILDSVKGRKRFIHVTIGSSFKADLQLWQNMLETWNGRCKWYTAPPVVIAHDASHGGFGFCLEADPSGSLQLPLHLRPGAGVLGTFSPAHVAYVHSSIQWAELFAIVCSIHCYGPYIRGSSIKLVTDNLADCSIINRQSSRSPQLMVLLRALYAKVVEFDLDIFAVHRPGKDNVFPDFLSRPELHSFCPQRSYASFFSTPTPHMSFMRSAQVNLVELNGTPSASLPLSKFLSA
jgi:hypothetical protein